MLADTGSITVKGGEPCALGPLPRPKTISYDPSELKAMQQAMLDQHDHRYKRLPIEAIKIIRTLRLNYKRRRHIHTAQKRKKLRPTKANMEHLIRIKNIDPWYHKLNSRNM